MLENATTFDGETKITTNQDELALLADFQLALIAGGGGAASLD